MDEAGRTLTSHLENGEFNRQVVARWEAHRRPRTI